MKQGILPKRFDVRKACVRELELSGMVAIDNLPRMLSVVDSDLTTVTANFRFGRDEERRYVIVVSVDAQVGLVCERCLGPLAVPLKTSSDLMLCSTEAQAQQCPSRYEPVIVEDEAMDLYDVIEEELLLALPVAPKHDHACVELPGQSQAEIEAEDRKPNPFEVLARLTDDSSES